MKKIVIIGGGTFSPIRNHLSLCAPAFGKTARQLGDMFNDKLIGTPEDKEYKVEVHLTKMADLLAKLLGDKSVRTIVMNCALCDFDAAIDDRGFHGDRLKTVEGEFNLKLRPADKLISMIRKVRPDIFLVGFKTTTNASEEEQFLTGLKMMKSSKCNLVLANDTVTRRNIIITPEEVAYKSSIIEDNMYKGGHFRVVGEALQKQEREDQLKELVEMTLARHDLTYTKTKFVRDDSIDFYDAPKTFKDVMRFVIGKGGFIENNGNGFTPGHFGYKVADGIFVSSQRKVNHNDVEKNGMTLVKVRGDSVTAVGSHKPSVGARSQALLFEKYPQYDCIVHVHCPLVNWLGQETYKIPSVPQKPFQCGSLECGLNTVNNMQELYINSTSVKKVKVGIVMLEKHGPNIMFSSKDDSHQIIDFINEVVMLGTKIT